MTTTTRRPMTMDIAKKFVFAGKSVVTLTNTKNDHVLMYKITQVKEWLWFVHVNFGKVGVRWRYVSCIHRLSPWRLCLTDKSKYCPKDLEWIVCEWMLRRIMGMDDTFPEVEMTHNGFCGRCGRLLTDDTSVEFGLGPICRKKVWADKRKEVIK